MYSLVAERRSALFQVIRECNLACLHCSQSAPHSGSSPLRPINLEQYKVRLSLLVDSGLRRVRLTGGEPLLHPQLADLVGIGVHLSLEMSLVTNGMLLERHAEGLARAGLSGAWISLYGASFAQYERVAQRTPPALGLKRAIRALRDMKVKVGMYCCLHSSAGEPDLSLLEYLADAGIDDVKFLQVMEQGRALADRGFGADLAPTLAAITNFRSSNPSVRIGVSMRSGQVRQFQSSGFLVPDYVGCVSGSPDSLAVDADGSVLPCCLFMGSSTASIETNFGDGHARLGRCPALPTYPVVPVDDFVCPLTYARL